MKAVAVIAAAAWLCSVASATAETVEVPFTAEHNQIIVQTKIANQGPFLMLLDTGTTPSAIDLALARQLGLALRGSANATTVPQLFLGALQADNLDAGAIDLSNIARAVGRPIQGVLGYSLLANRIVQIDYPRHLVRFLTAPPAPAPNSFRLPFRVVSDEPIIDVWANGVQLAAVLDTGFGGIGVLNPQAIDRLGLTEQVANAEAATGTGFNGTSQVRKGTIASLRVGPYAIDKPSVTFRLRGGRFDHMPADMNIGNQLLQNFVVTLNYQQRVATFQH